MPRNAPKMHSEQSKFLSLAAVIEHGPSGTYPRLNAVQVTLENGAVRAFTASVRMFDHNK